MGDFDRPASALAHRDDPDTSHQAAESIGETAKALRARIFAALQKGPAHAEALAAACGVSHLQAMKRLSDLKNAGLIEDSGARERALSGRSQIVWRVVPQ